MRYKLHAVPVFHVLDNYTWIIEDTQAQEPGNCAVIDPTTGPDVLRYVERNSLKPSLMLITHHHHDHTGGIRMLVENAQQQQRLLKVVIPKDEQAKIPNSTHTVQNGDQVAWQGITFTSLHVPGHTLGTTAYYSAQQSLAFTGDVLFAGGCGRVFEGDLAMMLWSLQKLAALPETTALYCGHEYTVRNLEFAHSIVPEDMDVVRALDKARTQRQKNLPTLPTTVAQEKKHNLFLRCDQRLVQEAVGCQGDSLATFAKLRRLRDVF